MSEVPGVLTPDEIAARLVNDNRSVVVSSDPAWVAPEDDPTAKPAVNVYSPAVPLDEQIVVTDPEGTVAPIGEASTEETAAYAEAVDPADVHGVVVQPSLATVEKVVPDLSEGAEEGATTTVTVNAFLRTQLFNYFDQELGLLVAKWCYVDAQGIPLLEDGTPIVSTDPETGEITRLTVAEAVDANAGAITSLAVTTAGQVSVVGNGFQPGLQPGLYAINPQSDDDSLYPGWTAQRPRAGVPTDGGTDPDGGGGEGGGGTDPGADPNVVVDIPDVTAESGVPTDYDTTLTNIGGGEALDCTGQIDLDFAPATVVPADVSLVMADFNGPGADLTVTFEQNGDNALRGTYGPFPIAPDMEGATTNTVTITAADGTVVAAQTLILDADSIELASDGYTFTVTASA